MPTHPHIFHFYVPKAATKAFIDALVKKHVANVKAVSYEVRKGTEEDYERYIEVDNADIYFILYSTDSPTQGY
jgi:hypothetical protein